MTDSIKIGDYIKARFWRGEAIWAKVTSIAGGSVDAVLANEPASPSERPDGWRNPLTLGSPVSCGIDDVLDWMRDDRND